MEEKITEEILNNWLECNAVCDLGVAPLYDKKSYSSEIKYYIDNLPGLNYVTEQMVNYLFANNLTTGSINEDEVLDKFLYGMNKLLTPNLSVLRDAVSTAIIYGSAGIRFYEGDIYLYMPGTYKALVRREDGVKRIVAYVVNEKHEQIYDVRLDYDLGDPESVSYYDIVNHLREQNLILLDTSEFLNLRNDTAYIYGDCKLLKDKLRVDLLIEVYRRLNYDIKYDGPGRIIIRPKEGYATGEDNEISTASVLNQSMQASKKRMEDLKAEIKRVATEIKKSSSDSVIALSNAFGSEITHLERVTKATEFLTWIQKQEGVIVAQVLGMSPSLLELGGISGNVSMEKIIDNAMVNSIVPIREKFATQFSPFFSENIGVSKVYFNKYEMQQAEDPNTMRTKIVNIMTLLNSIDTPKTKQLVEDFADMLSANIHNENSDLIELAVGIEKENDYGNERNYRKRKG